MFRVDESTIERNVNDLYAKYAANRINKTNKSNEDISRIAAELGYRPAVNKSAFFLGSTLSIGSYFDNPSSYPKKYGISNDTKKVDILENAIIEQILSPFLSNGDFETSKCIEVMDRIFEIYHFRECATDFSYGAAQKWVNMAIKYYIISSYKTIENSNNFTDYVGTHFESYDLFPIDGQMIKLIHEDYGDMEFDPTKIGCHLPTPQPWTNCNLKFTFIDYWDFVKTKLNPTKPILYEIQKWASNLREE